MCVRPDRQSVSEASVLQTVDPLHPHYLIRIGSTLLSEALWPEKKSPNYMEVFLNLSQNH